MSELQQFLSLMDTIHDYGNITRTTKAISRKEETLEDDDNEVESISFNKAYLLDFLMLSLIQDKFRENIGLSTHQNYLRSRENCKRSEKVKSSRIAQDICSKFYFPTYENKIIFRSPKPEEITKDILFASKGFPTETLELNLSAIKFANKLKMTKCIDASEFNTIIQSIFGKKNIHYITDANSLKNEMFQDKIYKGLFSDYDAAPSKRQNNSLTVNLDEILDDDCPSSINSKDKPIYFLEKSKDELIFLDSLGAEIHKDEYGIYFSINDEKYIINLEKTEDGNFSKGLNLFVQLINAINEKTLGVQQLRRNSKAQLQQRLEKLGIDILKSKYSVYLKLFESSLQDKTGILILDKLDFVMALFDFKRAMDYLYVKACFEANSNAKDDTKYVFVSSDRSAIFYALNLGCPCILTMPMIKHGTRKGEQDIIIYNPLLSTTVPTLRPIGDLSSDELKTLMEEILEDEKTYEALDEVEFLINQVKVNEDIIKKQLEKEKLKKRRNLTEIKRLEEINNTFDDVYSKLYELQYNIENKPKNNAEKEIHKKMVNSVNTEKETVENTSPYPRVIPSKDLLDSLPEDNKEIVEKVKKLIDPMDVKAKMNTHLTKKKCLKWLSNIAEYDEKDYYKVEFPWGLKGLKTDIPQMNKFAKDFRDYCLTTHNLQRFWDELVKEEPPSKSGGRDGNGIGVPPFIPSPEKAFEQLATTKVPESSYTQKMVDMLDEEIPITYNEHSSSMFDDFLKAYSSISPTITFFWYIVFRTIYFHLEDDVTI